MSSTSPASHPRLDAPDVLRVLREDATVAADHDPKLSSLDLAAAYRAMFLARALDLRLGKLAAEGRIGFHAQSLGEEAATIGAALALRDGDWLFPTHREIGAALVRGMPLARALDHSFGNATDSAKGRQMPGGFTHRASRVASVGSPLGAHLIHAAGLAWSARTKGEKLVTLAFLPGSAVDSGSFHDALNWSGVFKAPVIFLCKNDGAAGESIADRATAYGISTCRCDGGDLLAVHEATKLAIERAVAGGGPTIIDALTHRTTLNAQPNGHGKDGITRLREHLQLNGTWSDAAEVELAQKIEADLDLAVAASERMPAPLLDSMFDDVFAVQPRHLAEQRSLAASLPRAKRLSRSQFHRTRPCRK